MSPTASTRDTLGKGEMGRTEFPQTSSHGNSETDSAGARERTVPVPDALREGRIVSAVVVTYWTGDILFQCLDALLVQPELLEVILVDNGNPASVVGRMREIAGAEPRLRLIETGKNTGFAAGCNLGAAMAKSDFIAFVNPDCLVPPKTLSRILDVFADHRDAWLCGIRLENPDGTEQRGGRREVLTPWRSLVELLRLDRLFPDHPYFRRLHLHQTEPIHEVCQVPTVSGAFMVVPKWAYERVGGMDDNMFLHFDDSDLCIRLGQQGGRVLFCGHISVPHSLSTSDVSKTFIEWHKARSSSYYFYKHFHVSYPFWALLGVSVLLWLRFAFKAPILLASDLPGMFRRWRRR